MTGARGAPYRGWPAVVGLVVLALLLVSLLLTDPDAGDVDAEEGRGAGAGAGAPGPEPERRKKPPKRKAGGEGGGAAPAPSISVKEGTPKVGAATPVPHRLKVHIYDDLPAELVKGFLGNAECRADYTGIEVELPSLIATSSVYAADGEKADYYLVPVMSECQLMTSLHAGTDFFEAEKALNAAFEQALDSLQSRFPYWSRAEGRDHIFVFPSERGVDALNEENLLRIKKSVVLTGVNQEQEHYFSFWKDLVVPPLRRAPRPRIPLEADPSTKGRDIWLHFRGKLPGHEDGSGWGIRQDMKEVLQGQHGVLFEQAIEQCDRACMFQELVRSQFCLILPEVEGWSLRLYDAIALGCVPVVVKDSITLPYETFIDYADFLVKIPEGKKADIVEIVQQISSEKLREMQKALKRVAPAFQWPAVGEFKRNDAFDYLIRELFLKLRFMRNSPYRYWREPAANGR